MRTMSGHQPHYLASIEHFAKIKASDVYVYSDDVKYVRRDWQNRNRVPKPGGEGWMWLTVPVIGGDDGRAIHEKEIDNRHRWLSDHTRTLRALYRGSKMRGFWMVEQVIEVIEGNSSGTLADLNIAITEAVCVLLEIQTPRYRATSLRSNANTIRTATEKIGQQALDLGCDTYISGLSGLDYLDFEMLRSMMVDVRIFVWGPAFYGAPELNLSVVDLLARCGEEAKDCIGMWSLEKRQE